MFGQTAAAAAYIGGGGVAAVTPAPLSIQPNEDSYPYNKYPFRRMEKKICHSKEYVSSAGYSKEILSYHTMEVYTVDELKVIVQKARDL
jgi:hypothetical protein